MVDQIRNGGCGGVKCSSGKCSDSSAARVSLYEEVTANIIVQFEAGIFPWRATAAVSGLPRNAVRILKLRKLVAKTPESKV